MNAEHIKTAVLEGMPFQINMADGKSYVVPDRWRISFAHNAVVVVDTDGLAHILPLITITGLTYLKPQGV